MKVNTWQKKLTEGIYEMSSRKDAFIIAEDCARNKDDLTQRRWAIQAEMERLGFEYDSKKGEADQEKAYFPRKESKSS